MNRTTFFQIVRGSVFGGKLLAGQVEGLNKILDYRDEKWPNMPDAELAYVLATVKWETASTMQPITEYGSQKYLRGKRYWPWIGRGLVQITWEANYKKFGIDRPEQALEWPTALHVLFHGMVHGSFTGKRLSDYITNFKTDYVGARRIINGTDKKHQIAELAKQFQKAIRLAVEAAIHNPVTTDVVEPDAPELPAPSWWGSLCAIFKSVPPLAKEPTHD